MNEIASIPRLHPNGFIQYDLPSGEGRLHVWHPDIPVAQIVHTPIHDHTFNFESRIIVGELIHTVFAFRPDNKYGPTQVHEAIPSEGEETRLVPTGVYGYVEQSERHSYIVGDTYTFESRRYHMSVGAGGALTDFTATIMNKTRTGAGYPRILVPRGVDPDNNFKRTHWDAELLMSFVDEILKRWMD